jgi:hypothetical protein
MSTTSALLGAHAAPYAVHLGDKVYHARPITQHVKAAFEAWMAGRAMAAISHMADTLSPEKWAETVRGVQDRIDAGEYAFAGERCQTALAAMDGALKMASLVFGIDQHEMGELILAKPAEVNAVLQRVVRDSFPARKAAPQAEGDDPNG